MARPRSAELHHRSRTRHVHGLYVYPRNRLASRGQSIVKLFMVLEVYEAVRVDLLDTEAALSYGKLLEARLVIRADQPDRLNEVPKSFRCCLDCLRLRHDCAAGTEKWFDELRTVVADDGELILDGIDSYPMEKLHLILGMEGANKRASDWETATGHAADGPDRLTSWID